MRKGFYRCAIALLCFWCFPQAGKSLLWFLCMSRHPHVWSQGRWAVLIQFLQSDQKAGFHWHLPIVIIHRGVGRFVWKLQAWTPKKGFTTNCTVTHKMFMGCNNGCKKPLPVICSRLRSLWSDFCQDLWSIRVGFCTSAGMIHTLQCLRRLRNWWWTAGWKNVAGS